LRDKFTTPPAGKLLPIIDKSETDAGWGVERERQGFLRDHSDAPPPDKRHVRPLPGDWPRAVLVSGSDGHSPSTIYQYCERRGLGFPIRGAGKDIVYKVPIGPRADSLWRTSNRHPTADSDGLADGGDIVGHLHRAASTCRAGKERAVPPPVFKFGWPPIPDRFGSPRIKHFGDLLVVGANTSARAAQARTLRVALADSVRQIRILGLRRRWRTTDYHLAPTMPLHGYREAGQTVIKGYAKRGRQL